MRTASRLALATAVAAVAATAVPAGAAPAPSGEPAVSVDGTTVSVRGTIGESLTRVLGTDPGDDAVASGAGVDIAAYELGFPRAGLVEYRMVLADPNPATGYAPQGVVYALEATAGAQTLELTATPTLDSGLEFGAQTCDASSGVNQCTSTPVDGRYADGALVWDVPVSGVGTKVAGGLAEVNPSVTVGLVGGLTFTGGLVDAMSASGRGTTPTATVLVDGVAAGVGHLSDAGYEVSVDDVEPGPHALAVRLCDGTTAKDACTDVDLGSVTV